MEGTNAVGKWDGSVYLASVANDFFYTNLEDENDANEDTEEAHQLQIFTALKKGQLTALYPGEAMDDPKEDEYDRQRRAIINVWNSNTDIPIGPYLCSACKAGRLPHGTINSKPHKEGVPFKAYELYRYMKGKGET